MDDLQAAFQRYRAGEFDVLTDFPTDQYGLLQEQYPGEARVAPYLGLYYYVINQNLEEMQDVNVRKALSMAINREVIGPGVLGCRPGRPGIRRTPTARSGLRCPTRTASPRRYP